MIVTAYLNRDEGAEFVFDDKHLTIPSCFCLSVASPKSGDIELLLTAEQAEEIATIILRKLAVKKDGRLSA